MGLVDSGLAVAGHRGGHGRAWRGGRRMRRRSRRCGRRPAPGRAARLCCSAVRQRQPRRANCQTEGGDNEGLQTTGPGTVRHWQLPSTGYWCREGTVVNRDRRLRKCSRRATAAHVRTGTACEGGGRPASMALYPFGGGVIGNTTGSGPVVGGSSPPPRATFTRQSPRSAAWGFCLKPPRRAY